MFTVVDAIVLALLVACGYLGYKTGIVAAFFYILSGLGGLWLARSFSVQLGVNFHVLLLAAVFVILLAGLILHRLVGLFLGIIDSLAGALLGLVVGIFVVMTILAPLADKMPRGEKRKEFAASCTARRLVPALQRFFPGTYTVNLGRIRQNLRLDRVREGFDIGVTASTGPARGL
ncbi:MAG: CvpA family protein [Endomicrobiales bacterium]